MTTKKTNNDENSTKIAEKMAGKQRKWRKKIGSSNGAKFIKIPGKKGKEMEEN